jgi:hypothetical protein
LDATISIVVNRDQSAWARRKETLSVGGRDSPIPRAMSATPLGEKSVSVTDLNAALADDKNVQVVLRFWLQPCAHS